VAETAPKPAETEPIIVPKCPAGVKARGKHLWTQLHETYDFEDAPEKLILLEEAARTADVVKRLQAIVDTADHLRVSGSQGQPVAMPELGELRQYRAAAGSAAQGPHAARRRGVVVLAIAARQSWRCCEVESPWVARSAASAKLSIRPRL
jgi:hypothetical protein